MTYDWPICLSDNGKMGICKVCEDVREDMGIKICEVNGCVEGYKKALSLDDSHRHLGTYDWPTCLSVNGRMGV